MTPGTINGRRTQKPGDAVAQDAAQRNPPPGRRARLAAACVISLFALIATGAGVSSSTPTVREISLRDKHPLGSTHELALGPDGNVWVTQQDQSRLVRISPQGKVRFFALPPGLGPHGIAFD